MHWISYLVLGGFMGFMAAALWFVPKIVHYIGVANDHLHTLRETDALNSRFREKVEELEHRLEVKQVLIGQLEKRVAELETSLDAAEADARIANGGAC